jgi:acyl carrier protein
MKKKQFFKELQKIFEIKKNLNEEMLLSDINFDSLKILEMITLKEMYFKKLNIKPSDYNKCKKVKDLVKIFKIQND